MKIWRTATTITAVLLISTAPMCSPTFAQASDQHRHHPHETGVEWADHEDGWESEFSRTRHNADFERLLSLLLAQALIVEAPVLGQPVCRGPHDDKFIACALAVGADVIVSGDKDLLSISGTFNIPIVRPREFLKSYVGRGR
jgi:hypothetical protein